MGQALDETAGIPRFEFENGRGEKGWVEFVDPDDLSRADVKRLRKAAGSSENEGQASNAFFDEALAMLVASWEVPGRPDMQLPRHNPKAVDGIPATFSSALETHIRPYLKTLTRGEAEAEDGGEPGSPRRPGRG